MSSTGPPVCLPATGSVKGIQYALHHHTPHPLPPPHLQRLYHQGQPLKDDYLTSTTGHGPIHLTLRLVGLKRGGRRSHRDKDTDSSSDSDSDSHTRRKMSRKHSSKGELTQALRAMTSLADSVAGICHTLHTQHQPGAPGGTPQQQPNTDAHGARPRDQPQLQPGEPERPQARRRYCVSLDTRHGDRRVLLHAPNHQPQPPPPPNQPQWLSHCGSTPRRSPPSNTATKTRCNNPPPPQAGPQVGPMTAQPAPYQSETPPRPEAQYRPQAR